MVLSDVLLFVRVGQLEHKTHNFGIDFGAVFGHPIIAADFYPLKKWQSKDSYQ